MFWFSSTPKKEKKIVHYVGLIELQLEDKSKFSIQFLCKKENSCNFFFLDTSNVSIVNFEDIVRKLPQVQFTGGTSHAVIAMPFNVNFKK